MKIGDEIYVHGYIDEIRKDIVIIKNDGGYFGTVPSEIITERIKRPEPQGSAYDKCPICVNRNKNCQFGSLDCHFEEQIDE